MTIVCLIVSLQLFNISFDPADTFCGPEDLSINEIESCVELVVEIILGHEDAVGESDESDEAPNKPGSSFVLFSISNSSLILANPTTLIKSYQPLFKSAHIESLSFPILSPPPKLL